MLPEFCMFPRNLINKMNPNTSKKTLKKILFSPLSSVFSDTNN